MDGDGTAVMVLGLLPGEREFPLIREFTKYLSLERGSNSKVRLSWRPVARGGLSVHRQKKYVENFMT